MRGADAGGKLASTQIIICVHTYAVAERRGCKIRSATNGSNTKFSASASKPRAPKHFCPQEMADPPTSAPRICEHTRGSGSGAGMSKSARLRSATAPPICERSSKRVHPKLRLNHNALIFCMMKLQVLCGILPKNEQILPLRFFHNFDYSRKRSIS